MSEKQRFVVCGDGPMAFRLVEHLLNLYDVAVVAIVPSIEDNWGSRIAALEAVEVVQSKRLDAATFTRAGLQQASALALVAQDDAANVDAALIAEELKPGLRIVVRMYNRSLGERMGDLIANSAVLSAARIAAPAFVAAALNETTSAPIVVGDLNLVVAPAASVRPEEVVVGLARTEGLDTPETLPPGDADLVLIRAAKAAAPAKPHHQGRLRLLSLFIGPRLRIGIGVLVALFVAAAVALRFVLHVTFGEAAYVAIIAELSGADADLGQRGWERGILSVLTIVSVVLIPLLTAAVVDGVVRTRLRIEAGLITDKIAGHVVVVGLGDVGTRVIRGLNEAGADVVAIEPNANARGVQIARDLGIPVIIGDASYPEILRAAWVGTAKAMIIASTNDVSNLEIALLARVENPTLRVVVRLFDGDFAARVQQAFHLDGTASTSYLAVPTFAAAMLSQQVVATIPVRRRVLLIAELPIEPGSALEHQPVSVLSRDHESRLLGVRVGDGIIWRPSGGRPLRAGEKIIVIATRNGLSALLAQATAPATPEQPRPFRLLDPWQLPQPPAPRPATDDSTPDSAAGSQAGGPTESGTGPA